MIRTIINKKTKSPTSGQGTTLLKAMTAKQNQLKSLSIMDFTGSMLVIKTYQES